MILGTTHGIILPIPMAGITRGTIVRTIMVDGIMAHPGTGDITTIIGEDIITTILHQGHIIVMEVEEAAIIVEDIPTAEDMVAQEEAVTTTQLHARVPVQAMVQVREEVLRTVV